MACTGTLSSGLSTWHAVLGNVRVNAHPYLLTYHRDTQAVRPRVILDAYPQRHKLKLHPSLAISGEDSRVSTLKDGLLAALKIFSKQSPQCVLILT